METPTLYGKALELPKPVLTKQDFVRRYAAGEFGNRPSTWNTLSQLLSSGYRGSVHVRNSVRTAPTNYFVPFEEVPETVAKLLKNGFDERNLYYSQMGPETFKVFQGEVERSYRHLNLCYGITPKPMRQAFSEGDMIQVYGAKARSLLKHFLDLRSYEWLEYLLDTYEGHVIEFSTYSIKWGEIPGMNTVFWECRLY